MDLVTLAMLWKKLKEKSGGKAEVVDQLPQTGEEGVTYLVPKEGTAPADNLYEEWLWVNGAWERLSSEIDLSNYYNKEEVDDLIDDIESVSIDYNDVRQSLDIDHHIEQPLPTEAKLYYTTSSENLYDFSKYITVPKSDNNITGSYSSVYYFYNASVVQLNNSNLYYYRNKSGSLLRFSYNGNVLAVSISNDNGQSWASYESGSSSGCLFCAVFDGTHLLCGARYNVRGYFDAPYMSHQDSLTSTYQPAIELKSYDLDTIVMDDKSFSLKDTTARKGVEEVKEEVKVFNAEIATSLPIGGNPDEVLTLAPEKKIEADNRYDFNANIKRITNTKCFYVKESISNSRTGEGQNYMYISKGMDSSINSDYIIYNSYSKYSNHIYVYMFDTVEGLFNEPGWYEKTNDGYTKIEVPRLYTTVYYIDKCYFDCDVDNAVATPKGEYITDEEIALKYLVPIFEDDIPDGDKLVPMWKKSAGGGVDFSYDEATKTLNITTGSSGGGVTYPAAEEDTF